MPQKSKSALRREPEQSEPPEQSESVEQLLTVKQAARYLKIPLPTIYYLVQRGQLPAIQIQGRWRIKKADLQPKKPPTTARPEVHESWEDDIRSAMVEEMFRTASPKALSFLESRWTAISDSLARIEQKLISLD